MTNLTIIWAQWNLPFRIWLSGSKLNMAMSVHLDVPVDRSAFLYEKMPTKCKIKVDVSQIRNQSWTQYHQRLQKTYTAGSYWTLKHQSGKPLNIHKYKPKRIQLRGGTRKHFRRWVSVRSGRAALVLLSQNWGKGWMWMHEPLTTTGRHVQKFQTMLTSL